MENIDLEKIQKLLEIAKKKQVAELSLESKELKLSFSFITAPTISYPMPNTLNTVQSIQANQGMLSVNNQMKDINSLTKPTTASVEAVNTPSNSKNHYHEIKAPFVGTYYATPAPGEAPYIKVGDKVTKGQTICILEAMKIMNEIEADKDGEIVDICIENESFVEFGQVLVKIK